MIIVIVFVNINFVVVINVIVYRDQVKIKFSVKKVKGKLGSTKIEVSWNLQQLLPFLKNIFSKHKKESIF